MKRRYLLASLFAVTIFLAIGFFVAVFLVVDLTRKQTDPTKIVTIALCSVDVPTNSNRQKRATGCSLETNRATALDVISQLTSKPTIQFRIVSFSNSISSSSDILSAPNAQIAVNKIKSYSSPAFINQTEVGVNFDNFKPNVPSQLLYFAPCSISTNNNGDSVQFSATVKGTNPIIVSNNMPTNDVSNTYGISQNAIGTDVNVTDAILNALNVTSSATTHIPLTTLPSTPKTAVPLTTEVNPGIGSTAAIPTTIISSPSPIITITSQNTSPTTTPIISPSISPTSSTPSTPFPANLTTISTPTSTSSLSPSPSTAEPSPSSLSTKQGNTITTTTSGTPTSTIAGTASSTSSTMLTSTQSTSSQGTISSSFSFSSSSSTISSINTGTGSTMVPISPGSSFGSSSSTGSVQTTTLGTTTTGETPGTSTGIITSGSPITNPATTSQSTVAGTTRVTINTFGTPSTDTFPKTTLQNTGSTNSIGTNTPSSTVEFTTSSVNTGTGSTSSILTSSPTGSSMSTGSTETTLPFTGTTLIPTLYTGTQFSTTQQGTTNLGTAGTGITSSPASSSTGIPQSTTLFTGTTMSTTAFTGSSETTTSASIDKRTSTAFTQSTGSTSMYTATVSTSLPTTISTETTALFTGTTMTATPFTGSSQTTTSASIDVRTSTAFTGSTQSSTMFTGTVGTSISTTASTETTTLFTGTTMSTTVFTGTSESTTSNSIGTGSTSTGSTQSTSIYTGTVGTRTTFTGTTTLFTGSTGSPGTTSTGSTTVFSSTASAPTTEQQTTSTSLETTYSTTPMYITLACIFIGDLTNTDPTFVNQQQNFIKSIGNQLFAMSSSFFFQANAHYFGPQVDLETLGQYDSFLDQNSFDQEAMLELDPDSGDNQGQDDAIYNLNKIDRPSGFMYTSLVYISGTATDKTIENNGKFDIAVPVALNGLTTSPLAGDIISVTDFSPTEQTEIINRILSGINVATISPPNSIFPQ